MFRRIGCAVAILGLSLTFAAAEEIKGTILSVSAKDKQVVIRLKATEKGKKGEEKTLKIADKCKVCKQEAGEKTEIGFDSDLVKGIDPKKGVGGMVVTNTDNQVTDIVINIGKKKKDKK